MNLAQSRESARVRSMDWAAVRRTLLIVSVKEVGGVQKKNTRYSRGVDTVSVDGMRCGGLVGLPAITFGTT